MVISPRLLIGRYDTWILEASTRTLDHDMVDGVVVAGVDDLGDLSHLLAPYRDHDARVTAGDLCVVVRDETRTPVGLQWVNRVMHSDRYLGVVSRPTAEVAYVNQTVVDPAVRGQGQGRRLLTGTLALASRHDISTLRLLVEQHNATMLRLVDGLGFKKVGRQVGLRFGWDPQLELGARVRMPRQLQRSVVGGPGRVLRCCDASSRRSR